MIHAVSGDDRYANAVTRPKNQMLTCTKREASDTSHMVGTHVALPTTPSIATAELSHAACACISWGPDY